MNKKIETRQQLIERLNNIDRKCIDEGLHFHDLKTLYESKEYKLSSRDKADIKKVAAIEDDPDTLKAYIDSKSMEEGLEEDFEDDDYNNEEDEDESLTEASYGGAYDIEDDMFFTRDEINEFADEVANKFSAWANEEFYVNDVYMDSPKTLTVELTNNDITIQGETNIDFRKIKIPKDIDKYQDIILKQLKDALIEYESDINESLNEGKEDFHSNNIIGNTWQEFISNIESQTKYDVDSSYKRRPEKWIELINKETGDIFDAEVTKYFDGSYELMLYNVTTKYESLDESFDYEDFLNWCEKQYYPGFNPMDLSDEEYYALEDAYRKDNSLKESILTNDEYDYFNVYDEYGLVGEFPTYEDAKNACGEGCTINGVVQYGGNEYEETPLNEDINSEVGLGIVPFDYYIYFEGEAISEDSFIDERKKIFRAAEDDLFTFLNSDLVKDTVKEKLDITIEDIEFVDNILETSYETIHGVLNVYILDDVKISSESLFDVLNRLLYKWEYRTEITIQGPKRDVDDWDEWEADLYATAELDYSE